MIQYCRSPRASLRYLCHLDNPEKEQYLPEEVLTNSNITYIERIGKYEVTKKQILYEILHTINLEEVCFKYIEILEPNELNSIIRIAKEIKRFNNFKNIV